MAVDVRGDITIPTNPNGIVFTANARDVLAGRTWSEVQRVAAECLVAFHAESGLRAMAGLSWRVAVDRKNRRSPQVLVVYVVDGPATAAQLRLIEDGMHRGAVLWSDSQIERIPPNTVRSLMVADGRLYQLWEPAGSHVLVGHLVLGDRGVSIGQRSRAEVSDRDFLPDVHHRRARLPRYEDHDAELERMRLAFAAHYAQRIVEADGKVLEEETVFLETVFPQHLMDQLDLVDQRATDKWFARAGKALPGALGHHDKLAMIGLFFSACYSDGQLDAREMRVLKEAGEALGLTRHEVASYLERFW